MPRIVEVKDQTPLLIRPEDTVNGIVAVCRCGLSSNWPYCNGTHKATIGEEPGKLYHYDRTLPQGTPQRHEVDMSVLERSARDVGASRGRADDSDGAPRQDHHGASPVRPPRPAQAGAATGHAEPQRPQEEGVPPT